MAQTQPVRWASVLVLLPGLIGSGLAAGCRESAGPSVDTAAASLGEVQPSTEASAAHWQPDVDPTGKIVSFEKVEDFGRELAIFDTVFWEPADTTSLRKLLREHDLVAGRRVLEIGTGSGLVSLCCLQAGAAAVLATDVNQMAVSNAIYNARQLKLADRFEVRLVPLRDTTAWSVIGESERFDVIISNPPWEDDAPQNVADFALYDTNFALLRTLMEGLDRHLNPGGRVLLAYGCVSAVRKVQELAEQHGYAVEILDDRSLDDLPEVFLPGMLLQLRKQPATAAD